MIGHLLPRLAAHHCKARWLSLCVDVCMCAQPDSDLGLDPTLEGVNVPLATVHEGPHEGMSSHKKPAEVRPAQPWGPSMGAWRPPSHPHAEGEAAGERASAVGFYS